MNLAGPCQVYVGLLPYFKEYEEYAGTVLKKDSDFLARQVLLNADQCSITRQMQRAVASLRR